MTKRQVKYDQWISEAISLFGEDKENWKFVCPSCGIITSIKEWIDVDANEGEIAFSCIGRRTNTKNTIFSKKQPCNYAGGGLFQLNPVEVITNDGKKHSVFEFYKK